jgi:AcrR family transcriptional regulator
MADGAQGRPNQKRRTRKDLLEAAERLMKEGRKPTLEEVAEAALVSRATAYRYFPSIEALLLEASLDVAAPNPDAIFKDERTGDPVARMERVDQAFEVMMSANEPALRLMLAQALERTVKDADTPNRQNRRTPLIEAALAPARKDFRPGDFDKLKKALALIVGAEALLVFKDVLQVDEAEARKVKRWAMRALIDAARK